MLEIYIFSKGYDYVPTLAGPVSLATTGVFSRTGAGAGAVGGAADTIHEGLNSLAELFIVSKFDERIRNAPGCTCFHSFSTFAEFLKPYNTRSIMLSCASHYRYFECMSLSDIL